MSRTPAALRAHHRDGAASLVAVTAFRRSGGGPGNTRGAVTAEFAVALPAVLLLLAMLLAGVAGGVTQLRLEEAARAGARVLARGEDPAAIEAVVRTLAGASATATVAADGEWLSVTVADRVGGPLGANLPWTLTAKATARNELAAAQSVSPRPVGTPPAPSHLAHSHSAPSPPAPQSAPSPPASSQARSAQTVTSRPSPGKPQQLLRKAT